MNFYVPLVNSSGELSSNLRLTSLDSMMDVRDNMLSRSVDGGAHSAAFPAVSPHNSSLSVSPTPDADFRGCKNGALMDSFGIFLQGLLAVVAFSTLMCEYGTTFHINILYCLKGEHQQHQCDLRQFALPGNPFNF